MYGNKRSGGKSRGLAQMLIGILAISVSGFLLGSASLAAEVEDGDTNNSSTSSTLDTQEKCTWFVEGIPESVALEIASSESITKYDGTELDLESESPEELTAYTSGNLGTGTASANTECTFYSQKTGIAISKSVSTYAFTAAVGGSNEAGMGFTLSSSNSLDITFTEGTCWTDANSDEETSGWTVGNASLYDAENNSSGVLSLGYADVQMVNTNERSERCTSSGVYSVSVPAGKTPAAPGSNYVFTGPTVSTNITLPSS